MKLPFRRERDRSRGQALVEMAIILPVLVMLLLLAVDFGRVFFGWIALTNASRIGANEVAKNPTPWAAGDTNDLFYERMSQDLAAINCVIPDYDGDGNTNETDGEAELIEDLQAASAPAVQPVFIENAEDAADPYQVGDEVSVTLHCDFGFLTPLVGNIVGDPLTITATSTFMIFGGEINGIPIPPDPVPAGCIGTDIEVPDLTGMTVQQARDTWTSKGFTGSFTPSSGSDTNVVTDQTTSPSAEPGDCLLYTASVSVAHQLPDTECDTDESQVPITIGLTVGEARAAWTGAGFTGGFVPLTGSDSDIVDGFDITPDDVGEGDCAVLTSQVNVDHTPGSTPTDCTMTQILGNTIAQAEAAYRTRGFTGTFTYNPTNKPNWVVKTQNLIGGQTYACTANLHVQLEAP